MNGTRPARRVRRRLNLPDVQCGIISRGEVGNRRDCTSADARISGRPFCRGKCRWRRLGGLRDYGGALELRTCPFRRRFSAAPHSRWSMGAAVVVRHCRTTMGSRPVQRDSVESRMESPRPGPAKRPFRTSDGPDGSATHAGCRSRPRVGVRTAHRQHRVGERVSGTAVGRGALDNRHRGSPLPCPPTAAHTDAAAAVAYPTGRRPEPQRVI